MDVLLQGHVFYFIFRRYIRRRLYLIILIADNIYRNAKGQANKQGEIKRRETKRSVRRKNEKHKNIVYEFFLILGMYM